MSHSSRSSMVTMASWRDESACFRLDLSESDGIVTSLSCGSLRESPVDQVKPIASLPDSASSVWSSANEIKSETRLLSLQRGIGDEANPW